MDLDKTLYEWFLRNKHLRVIKSQINYAAESIAKETKLMKNEGEASRGSIFDNPQYRQLVANQVRHTYEFGETTINQYSKDHLQQYDRYFGKSRIKFYNAAKEFEEQMRRWEPDFQLISPKGKRV